MKVNKYYKNKANRCRIRIDKYKENDYYCL